MNIYLRLWKPINEDKFKDTETQLLFINTINLHRLIHLPEYKCCLLLKYECRFHQLNVSSHEWNLAPYSLPPKKNKHKLKQVCYLFSMCMQVNIYNSSILMILLYKNDFFENLKFKNQIHFYTSYGKYYTIY